MGRRCEEVGEERDVSVRACEASRRAVVVGDCGERGAGGWR
jgi:hypothetical protein